MFGTVISSLLIAMGSVLIGQAVLWLCGTRSWSWLAPSIGLAVAMVAAAPGRYLPGRTAGPAAALAIAMVVGAIFLLRRPTARPPVVGLLAGAPVLLLSLVPFAVNGHAGTLGVSVNNDMAFHLGQADVYRSEEAARHLGQDRTYPVGPAALVATVGDGTDLGTVETFAGLTLASPLLLGWTALAALRRARWLGQLVVATVVGMPFLVAAYYGQGSFKEVQQALFVLAAAICLQQRSQLTGAGRWTPFALLVAGTVSVYSLHGAAWPAAFAATLVAGLALGGIRRRVRLGEGLARLRSQAVPLVVGTGVLLLVITPQLARLARFVSENAGTNVTGIEKTNLGNLIGRLPVWQMFGVWDNVDYRLPSADLGSVRVWAIIVAGLAIAGAVWWLRTEEWFVPVAAAIAVLIWVVSDRTQSPYVAGKALVIASPLLMLLAVRWLVDWGDGPSRAWRPVLRVAAASAVALLVVKVNGSSLNALRYAKVGPQDHLTELRQLGALIGGGRTLFLGNDDFIRWELAGTPVEAPVVGFQGIPTRPEKPWSYGQPFDLDSLDTSVLNRFEWIIAPRDAAGSAPPGELRQVKVTRSFVLWRRTAEISARWVLPEGPEAGAVLDCSTPAGQQVRERGGVAAVRDPTVTTSVPPLEPGAARVVRLTLGPGTWVLHAQYTSQHALVVTGPGLRSELPASLDRPGTRWRIGQIRMTAAGNIGLRVDVTEPPLSPTRPTAVVGAIIAARAEPPRLVPVDEACGRLVDWYRPSSS